MPATQDDHWKFTIQEWRSIPFQRLLDAVPPVDVLYDIGANVGGFTFVLRERFPQMQAICIEPVKKNFEYLQGHVTATCVNVGIYYGADEGEIMEKGDNNVGGYFLEFVPTQGTRTAIGERVQLCTLESLNLTPPDCIKMDVEGGEVNIIEHSSIVKECPTLIIEWHPADDPLPFFAQHLPDHVVKARLENQFVLCRK